MAAVGTDETSGGVASSYLLDSFPDALAAYSLRRLGSGYTGPAIRVKRSSDGTERDIGFDDVGNLDTQTLDGFVGSGDGFVVRWYSQLGHPPLVPHGSLDGPLIVDDGAVVLDSKGLPRLKFFGLDGLFVGEGGLPAPIPADNFTLSIVMEAVSGAGMLQLGTNEWERYTYTLFGRDARSYWITGIGSGFGDSAYFTVADPRTVVTIALSPSLLRVYDKHERIVSTGGDALSGSHNTFSLGAPSRLRDGDGAWTGYVSELLIHPYRSSDASVQEYFDAINSYWQVGTQDYNAQALLPQQFPYQVDLYDWLETLDVSDVVLPRSTFTWDGTGDMDLLADVWLQLDGASASRVVRAEPEWYVLDAGNGKGIEATGEVRIWHEPGNGYNGNPPRSWANEPAYLYQLQIPRSDGSEGNPYYHDPALGRRALVVASVDMMMYHRAMLLGGSAAWTDMFGKAMLSWAEAYRWCGHLLDENTRQAYERGLGYFLEKIISQGARAVNTNMDMFPMQAAAEIYMTTDDPELKLKALRAVKRTLLGYPDGELGSRHDVFATGDYSFGVFDPSGFIMEGDQPDIFYLGESLYHLMGAVAAVSDRDTGAVPAEWEFLEEIVHRITEWVSYQVFYDPGVSSSGTGGTREAVLFTAGSGFAGRTGEAAPDGQANEAWKHLALADKYPAWRFMAARILDKNTKSRMESDIADKLSQLTSNMASVHTGTPPTWNGWSPWAMKTPYLPQKGWYSRLKGAYDAADPTLLPPSAREDEYYNRAFGGHPTGNQYWAYKQTDGTRDWGFFVEAQARQGGYAGWYGGKIETFWTKTTGVVLLNRHGKTGCDGNQEDSICWENLEYKAAHHVWGRDENGSGFTTLFLRGHDLQRTATFELGGSSPAVGVTNVFNDPSLSESTSKTGEQSGTELQGNVAVTNIFEALSDGVRVTHTIVSNRADEVSELFASLPVYLRHYNPLRVGDNMQNDLDDTSIEYWDGVSWKLMPEDLSGDDIPEFVTTTALRLGRDFMLGAGPQYVYVEMSEPERVRLSTQAYYDPYQTKTGVRTVHIDLHGNPGIAKTLPSETAVTYEITTTEPQANAGTSGTVQRIELAQGWNMVSSYVQPEASDLDAVFADVAESVLRVEDDLGRVYSPAENVDELGAWTAATAYMVFAANPVALELRGSAVDGETTVSLTAGGNWLPFPSSSAVPIEDALAPIYDRVMLVKDEGGNIFHPGLGIKTLTMLRPGHAYRVQLSGSAEITFDGP